MAKNKMLANVSMALTFVGAVNWGLVGVAGLFGLGNGNIVNMLLGSFPMVENIVYTLVGASALYLGGMTFKWWK